MKHLKETTRLPYYQTKRLPYWLNRNVFSLGLVSFFTDISTEMIYPLLSSFYKDVLKVPMPVFGLIEGIAEGTASVMKGMSGWLSDRWGRRKPLVFFGYSLAAVAKILLALAFGWWQALLARFIDRFGKGVRTSARDALLADSSSPEQRGRVYGFHRGMDTAGAVLGPLFCAWLLYHYHLTEHDYRLLFAIAFLPALCGVLCILAVKESKGQRVKESESRAVSQLISQTLRLSDSQTLRLLNRDFKAFVLVSAFFALGNSSDLFLIRRAKDFGLADYQTVLCYALYNFVYCTLALPAGSLCDRIGAKKVTALGWMVFAGVYAGFAFCADANWLWLLFAVYGGFWAMTEGVGKAWVSLLAKAEVRGTAFGIYHAVMGLCALAASGVAGLLWQHVSPSAVFAYGTTMAAAAALLLLILLPNPQQSAISNQQSTSP